jgi:hypothetical protein
VGREGNKKKKKGWGKCNGLKKFIETSFLFLCVCPVTFMKPDVDYRSPHGTWMSQKTKISFSCSHCCGKEKIETKPGIFNGQFYIRVCVLTFVMCSACFIFFY